MKIALDAMGGDSAPGAVVQGALDAAAELGSEIILVGDRAAIESELRGRAGPGITIQHAGDAIGPGDPPVAAVRRKPDSSLVVAVRLVKEGQADAVVSAGSTGALLAAGLFGLGRLPGVERPAVGTALPTRSGRPLLLLDAGANVDSRPDHLIQFAIMGRIYAETALECPKPRVGLLNNGSEAEKGNELTKAAYPLLEQVLGENFAGNVEPRDLPRGIVDVVVCDGFVGNVILKLYEGLAPALLGMVGDAFRSSFIAKIGGLLARPALRAMAGRFDYSEYGGAPLLGLRAPVIKCHGSSNARAIRSGLRVAQDLTETGAMARIAEQTTLAVNGRVRKGEIPANG